MEFGLWNGADLDSFEAENDEDVEDRKTRVVEEGENKADAVGEDSVVEACPQSNQDCDDGEEDDLGGVVVQEEAMNEAIEDIPPPEDD